MATLIKIVEKNAYLWDCNKFNRPKTQQFDVLIIIKESVLECGKESDSNRTQQTLKKAKACCDSQSTYYIVIKVSW